MARKYLIFLAVVLALALSTATIALADTYKPDKPVGVDSGGAKPDGKTETDADAVAEIAIAPESLWPGPDGYGYFGIDEMYNWIEITTTGTLVTGWSSKDDGYAGPFPIGFTFSFYGTDWLEFYTGSNGFLSFGAGATTLTNQCPLPSASAPNNIIPILWDDLNLNVSGDAYYQTFADCPLGTGQCLVVEYYNAAHYGGVAGSAGTWEAILYESGDVVLQFQDSGVELGSSSTTGMENNNAASDYGLTYACNTAASIPDGLSIRMFIPPPAPDLRDSYKEAPYLVTEGNLIHYNVVISNSGNAPALDAWMEDAIPDGVSYLAGSLTCDAGTCYYDDVGDLIRWDGELPLPPQPVSVEFDVTPDACGLDIVNTAVISDPAALAPSYSVAETFVVGDFYYTEDFEVDDGGYVSVGVNPWTWGPPPQGSLPLSTNAWSTEMPYAPNSDYQLVSDWIDLSGVSPDAPLNVGWWQYLWIESATYDHAYVEITTDEINWTVLWEHTGPTYNSGGWEPRSADITDFIGQQVKLRFSMDSDGSVQYDGWAIDDVVIYSGCAFLPPDIVVDPLSLAAVLPPDATTTLPLNISNVGESPLQWSIANWFDNFDSYVAGSQIHGQGGWKGWFNDPAGGALVSDLYSHSPANSVEIVGASDLVHEYSGYTSGTWTYTAWQYIPSGFSGQSYFILLNTYNDQGIGLNWSTQVTFNSATGLVENLGITGGTLPMVTDQWVELRVEIDLDTDTQAFYYDGQLLYAGTWTDENSGDGALNIGAVDLFANGSSPVYYDDISLADELPSWLSVAPDGGVVDPGLTTLVDVTFDSTGLATGVYTTDLEISSNDPDQPLTTVAVTLTVVGYPDIVVDAPPLEATLPPDATTAITLTISNVGEGPLDWSLAEVEGMEVNVKQINTVLWDNGPLVTHPGGGSGGADASALQTALGLTIYGFGNQFSVGNRMADDFTIVDPGGWTIDQITFYGYQTNAPTNPSPIAGLYYQIWDGSPDDPGSNVVFGDLSTNRLVSSTWANMYRVLDTDMMNTARAVFANVASAGVNLPPGTYWLDWTTDGNPAYSGPWAPPISILGETVTGDALQYTGAWAPAMDGTFQQGLPFVIEGPGSGFDLPWLSEAPTAGSLLPGETVIVEVTFDSTGLTPDIYTGGLAITSNDPDEPVVSLPVTLTVTELALPPDIEVDPLALEATLPVDGTTSEPLTISNVGEMPLDWLIFEAGWYENFDSYAPGSQMHGQGGWKGWFNNPDAGALVSDLYAHSSPNSVEIVNVSDLVHEYAGYTSGTWTFTAWQYLPDEYSGETYFIMLNTYNDQGIGLNWSTQVRFNSATGLVENAGITPGTLPLITGQWVELRLVIDLDNDTQAFYYGGDLLYEGTWTDENSGDGALNIAAVDLWGNSASEVYYDDISLMGGGPEEIPWLSVTPDSGTIDPGSFTLLNAEFDATGMAVGEYTANLYIASNDPDEPVVTVPVTMTVVNPAITLVKTVGTEAGVCADTDAIEVVAGTEVYYCYTVENVGEDTLYFHTLNDSALGELFSDMELTLGVGESYSYIHSAVAINESVVNTGTWYAYLELGGYSVSAVDTASVTVLPPVIDEADLSVDKDGPVMVYVGEDITYQLTVANAGPADATGVTLVDTLPAGVTFVSASTGCVEASGVVTCEIGDLAAGASMDITIVVTAPAEPVMLTNSAEVSGDQPDSFVDNNTDSFDTDVEEVPVEFYQFYLPLIFKP